MQTGLALARQAKLSAVADRAANRALAVWRSGMNADFDAAWAGIVARLTDVTAAGQIAAAAGSSAYLARVASADGNEEPSAGDLVPEALAGVDASGRTLDGLLYGAVTTSKTAIGGGADLRGALLSGATYLNTMVHTAVLDTGRGADLTAMTARHYTHYVRAISAGACSRCAMLAGISSARTPFLRHPRCRCTAVPVTDDGNGRPLLASSRFASPEAYFQSMTDAEQDRIFTRAGAEAIRAGADPVAVVSARRGAPGIDYGKTNRTALQTSRRIERTVIGRRADGTPILGYTTGEGTTRFGAFAQRNKAITGTNARRVRLMPETIIGLTDDPQLRTILLRDAGYLDVSTTAGERRAALGGGYTTRRARILQDDRVTADAFYRAHGIRL